MYNPKDDILQALEQLEGMIDQEKAEKQNFGLINKKWNLGQDFHENFMTFDKDVPIFPSETPKPGLCPTLNFLSQAKNQFSPIPIPNKFESNRNSRPNTIHQSKISPWGS